eukprot:CAMPEP_0181351624 /NCGR_PEP_ID=MMETSP1106-20121128/1888_1 /TAXON_ID=81844 /ORGANISM="Mantoniella antarctica, Strain SL-175" /LENGTH=55 /DNA_ID=CAMNT_0023464155 /DNA_START=359 /DNA_END=529 /DNA_ORIENTATION=-
MVLVRVVEQTARSALTLSLHTLKSANAVAIAAHDEITAPELQRAKVAVAYASDAV